MNKIDTENYKPEIVIKDNGLIYVQMLLEGEKCHICKKIMIKKSDYHGGLFPRYHKIDQYNQMERSNLVYYSRTMVDNKIICDECETSGKADFKCKLCNERKPTSKIQFTCCGDFLCSDCYENVSAKIWEEKIDELEEDHKYDHF